MAEVFSVVASGVGVAGVAAQFADGIRKLCQFCKDVRDAPEEVRYAINELGLLTNLLSAMEVELTSQRTRFSAHANYEAVLVFCQQGTEQTTTIMAELDAAISKRGKRGSLRAAWKKPELDRYLQKIERAKTSLMFAYQQYTNISITARIDDLRVSPSDSGALTTRASPRANPSTAVVLDSSRCVSKPSKKAVITAAADVNFSDGENDTNTPAERLIMHPRCKRVSSQTSYVRFQLPHWLLNKVWAIGVRRAIAGWDVKYRAYRIVPDDNELFEACVDLDIDRVRSALVSGEVSVLDKGHWGFDALMSCLWQFSLRYSSHSHADVCRLVEICRLLIESGADVNARDRYNHSLVCLLGTPGALSRGKRAYCPWTAIARLLLGYGVEVNDSYDQWWWISDPGPEVITLWQAQMWPPWNERPLADYVITLVKHLESSGDLSPQSYRAILGSQDLLDTWCQCPSSIRNTLTVLMIGPYGNAVYYRIEAEVAEWRDLYREAVHLGIDLHSPEDVRGRKSTLMLEFLSACIVWRADPYETVLTDFIGEIQSWGVDILEFGREEERVIRTLENKELIPRWYNEFETIVRMTGFSYGPRVEDWQIWLSNPLDEWAGEFWDMVEHPERRSLPGAWVDEDS